MAHRILIAEDNDSVAAAVTSLLERHGFAPSRAADGARALSLIAAAPPDLLLLDLRLPRLHGIELLKKLRQSPKTRELPVVIVTGAYRGERYVQAARALGVAHYLEKPFKASDLLRAVREATAGTGTGTGTGAGDGNAMQPFDRHLLQVFRERFSGTLHLAGPESERTLTLVNGSPVSLRPGFTARDFGDHLRRSGRLSDAEYAYYSGPGGFRHDCLVQLGCLDYPALLEEKLGYLQHELVAAFEQPSLAARRTPLALPPALQVITVNVPRILYQGYHRILVRDAARQLLAGHGERFVGCTPDFRRFINFLPLNEEERYALLRLDGRQTVLAAFEGRPELAPLLGTLLGLGMVRFAAAPLAEPAAGEAPYRSFFNAVEMEFEAAEEESLESFADVLATGEEDGEELALPEAPPATAPAEEPYEFALAKKVRQTAAELEGKNYYQVFGLTPGTFSFDRLRERYFAVTREFGPDVLMRLVGEEAAMVETILATVTTAYNTLSDVVKKERYDEMLGSDRIGLGQKGDDRFQAEVQAQSGKVFLEMEEWDNAAKALQDAFTADPDNGDYLAHLAWAIYRNPKNANSRAMLEKARQQVNRALTLERTPHGFAFKGWMLLEGGQDGLAEAEFNKALKLDARHALARRGLRTLQEKREQEKKGLFRRMFR